MHTNLKNGVVMVGLDPAIHDLIWGKDVDARHEAGHDEIGSAAA
jgi:hypothetical protein